MTLNLTLEELLALVGDKLPTPKEFITDGLFGSKINNNLDKLAEVPSDFRHLQFAGVANFLDSPYSRGTLHRTPSSVTVLEKDWSCFKIVDLQNDNSYITNLVIPTRFAKNVIFLEDVAIRFIDKINKEVITIKVK